MMNLSRTALAAVCLFLLAGCQDRYRYSCMDKANWSKDECMRPACAVTRTCPDHLLKPEEMQGEVR